MIRFEKVSYTEFLRALGVNDSPLVKEQYDNIKLPQRSTTSSAGYDFFAPFELSFNPHPSYSNVYPTGIRFVTDRDDVVLLCLPRSGLGFKCGTRLMNTVGVIDADYCNSSNEGHIMFRMLANETVYIPAGKAFMQGIIVPFMKVDNESCIQNKRDGGFGSTDKE